MPEQRTEALDHLDEIIAEARQAARAAGVEHHDVADFASQARTSLTFHVEAFDSAKQATALQEELNALPGVTASAVFGTRNVFVTAPEGLALESIESVFSAFGLRAWMSRTSLRRRAERINNQNAARIRRGHMAHRRAAESMERAKRQNNPQAFLAKWTDSTEVLFTARELITRGRLLVAVLLGLPVIVLQLFSQMQFDGWQWVCLALATPVVTWSAWPFHRAMLGGLRRGMSALDAASSAAIVLAYAFSLYQLFFTPVGEIGWRSHQILLAYSWTDPSIRGSIFLDVACGATILVLIGRLLSRRNSLRSRSLLSMFAVSPTATVEVVRKSKKTTNGKTRHNTSAGVNGGSANRTRITVAEIRTGDDIVIPTGAIVPVDGEIISGRAEVDMGPVGGLHRRVQLSVGDAIFAGATNHGQTLKVRTQRTGSATKLASMHRWVMEAARDENRLTYISTKSASFLVPWAGFLSFLSFLFWFLFTDSLDAAMATSLSVLACVAPVALAMSAPLALRLGLWRAATQGALLHQTASIHQLSKVEAVVFNRVGTLTHGPMRVIGVTAAEGENPDLVLRVASALSVESTHAVSVAIVKADREARDANSGSSTVPAWLEVGDVAITKDGVFEANVEIPVEGEQRIVTARLWRPRGIGEIRDHRLAAAAESGGSPIVVSWKGKDRGVILITDSFKDDAATAVDRLEEMNLETFMLSRDPYPVARKFADSIGISTVLAGIAPDRKEATVRGLHAQGLSVAMVGDNDVVGALRAADVGIVMGAGKLGAESHKAADVVLLRSDVEALPDILNLVRHLRNTVDWNIWFAWGYNIIMLLLAACGLLNPLIATVLMLASSALIEMRSERILSASYGRTVRRSTHAWTNWLGRIRAMRELRQRSELRAEAIALAHEKASAN